MNCMLHFVHDDAGYLAWLSGHPDGFVINTYARVSEFLGEVAERRRGCGRGGWCGGMATGGLIWR